MVPAAIINNILNCVHYSASFQNKDMELATISITYSYTVQLKIWYKVHKYNGHSLYV